MLVDKNYCMSSFLMFRCIADKNKTFAEGIIPQRFEPKENRYKIKSSDDIDKAIKEALADKLDEKTGIMLSSGIDSAILAKYMPKGAKAYTLNAIADNAINEVPGARKYAEICNLEHNVVPIYWEDHEKLSERLMEAKGAPIHSIEVQIYKAALQAKADGLEKLVFGESADVIFGGMDGLLSKDWLFDEFVSRYTYVMPDKVLKEAEIILEPYEKFRTAKGIDAYKFTSEFFYREGASSYLNACSLAGIEFIAPFSEMKLDIPLDLDRIRSGDSKYLVRELFKKLYPGYEMGEKTPMPRPMGQWLSDWRGPERDEFIQVSMDDFTGDQKWLIYILEKFLNMLDKK